MSLRDSTFWPMLWKEFIEMRRDRVTLGMMVGLPALQLVVFGYAIRTEVRHLPTVVLDQSRSSESRALVSVMRNTGNFDITESVASRAEVEDRIVRGMAKAALIIPPDYMRDLKRGRTASAQMIVDAADALASAAALAGAAQAGQARTIEIVSARTNGVVPIEVRVRPWYNPSLRSSAYIVPGIIGILLAMTLIPITSMAVVRERERGTLEQLIVTPIGKTSLMLGKLMPFVLVAYVQMTVVIILGKLLFDIPIRGSVALLYAITLGYIVANLALGLFVSTVARSQMQAMQLGMMFLLPNVLLSGFMFPREAMPPIARWIGFALPLTYYLDVVRGVLLKGVGFHYLWRDTVILAAFASVTVTLAVRRFSKTVE
ncbi:MAG: ABC transporter permease [Gemmatimonadaceae bacterium]